MLRNVFHDLLLIALPSISSYLSSYSAIVSTPSLTVPLLESLPSHDDDPSSSWSSHHCLVVLLELLRLLLDSSSPMIPSFIADHARPPVSDP